MIETDRIDILVDLAGHTGGNRLPVMAYKPAPIQATYLGYFETTGMEQIDYFLTDELTSPPQSQQFHTEELVFLPGGFLCYKPPDCFFPITPLPAAQNGHITFGIFGNNCKINSSIISLWARILDSNENSRLLLMFRGGQDRQFREHYFRKFEQFGIPRHRVDILDRKPLLEYFKEYSKVDIVLDTYPYNGGTTTCDAMWMGVPVVSLCGEHHMSRVGLSILSNVGLEFFAASTPDEYVSKTIALAAKPKALMKIRASMRARMAVSPLCNRDKFAANIEQAYRKMWYKWCKSKGVDVPSEELRPDAQRLSADTAACPSKSTQATTNPLGET